MASDTQTTVEEQQSPQPKVQIYSPSNGEISAFWRDKYEREAKKYWDIFYKRHQDKFFKDRHYLDKEWGHYFSGAGRKVILEVGCGAGNTIFPLLSTYPDLFINACDFSPRAVSLVKMHKEFTEARVNAFVCDLTADDLTLQISPSSVDVVTMIFVLSAVNPQKMPLVLQNIRKVLKPNGYVLFRDYAIGDLAQEDLSLHRIFRRRFIVTVEDGKIVSFDLKNLSSPTCLQLCPSSTLPTSALPKQIKGPRVHAPGTTPMIKSVWGPKIAYELNRVELVLKRLGEKSLNERLTHKEQKISENFYVRGDGTRAFYFSDEFLTNLFKDNGFGIEEHVLCCKQVENRSREIVMNRRWVQAVYCAGNKSNRFTEGITKPLVKNITPKDAVFESEIDMSDGMASEMFGISSFSEEVELRDYYSFKIKVLSKEYQHTCKSTGLMLWESARLMASVLATNPSIVAGKRVLELGCGCAGICSMVAARTADLVVATDGDMKALDLLAQNVALNLESSSLAKLVTKGLEWGNRDDIEAIKQLNGRGFDVIIGTDVTYIPEAIVPLFKTARELIAPSNGNQEQNDAALILCHVFRRVDEPSIVSAASQSGFRLTARWPEQNPSSSLQSISNWLVGEIHQNNVPTAALNIMYFQRAH